ncbi:MAG: outer membrane lipoprotein LolB [Rhodoferax sp.]|nr:outer membrane lipoprotein LolB [Rhodoferax sp.]
MRPLRARLLAGLALALLLGGCASPRPQPDAATASAHWQGRLSVKVYSKPVQAFSASFDLLGNPDTGELLLTSPLGTTLARLQWQAGRATLTANGEQRGYGSLQELAFKATGADLPVSSLFAWLQGQAEEAPGWQVDLSELAAGRIKAEHIEEVQSELKIILDR